MKLETTRQLSLLPLPKFLQIEPVGQCNLRCRMCPIAFRQDGPPWGPPAFIDAGLFRRIVDQFDTLEELHLQGLGEPMMHPEFFALVRYASDRGIKVSTNTNLTLLTTRRARECVESGLHALHASIDGATAETYEYIRRDANFSKVIANLDRLINARTAAASETPSVRIVAVAMRRNLAELPGIVRLAREHGVDTVFIQHLCHDYGEGTLPGHYHAMRDFFEEETLENEETSRLYHFFSEARRVADELAVDLRLPPLVHGEPRQPSPRGCDWPHTGAYLSYRGEAMPCCMVSTPDRMKLGDMARESPVAVWNGRSYREFREALASGDPPEICRGCGIYNGTF
jgi:MoaA/NifB/PqqE/SkfB family radical SAM enzyme